VGRWFARVGRRFRIGAAAVVLLAGVGCGTPKPPAVDFSSVPRDYSTDDYPVVYERWTRHEKVVRDTESVLEVWATFKSRDYREAFVARYAEAYALSAADRERLLQAQRELTDATYEFLVTAQSANYRWNDLEKKNSAWRVTLVDGKGHEMVPDGLKVEKLPDMFERAFFPVKTPFTKTYTARFPRTGGRDDEFVGERTGVVILRFAGPLGHADLEWTSRGS
jgi:hypothetical protein